MSEKALRYADALGQMGFGINLSYNKPHNFCEVYLYRDDRVIYVSGEDPDWTLGEAMRAWAGDR